MSADAMKDLHRAVQAGVFTRSSQISVLVPMCWSHIPGQRYVEPSHDMLKAWAVVTDRRNIQQVIKELRVLGVLAESGRGEFKRYELTFEYAIGKKRPSGALPLDSLRDPLIPSDGINGSRATGSSDPVDGINGSRRTGGTYVQSTKKKKEKGRSAAAAAAADLPLLGIDENHKHAKRVEAEHARVEYTTYQTVLAIALEVLRSPALQLQLLGYPIPVDQEPQRLDHLEAVKRCCARRRVPGYQVVVQGASASALFQFRNPNVIAGTAPRPRDVRREA